MMGFLKRWKRAERAREIERAAHDFVAEVYRAGFTPCEGDRCKADCLNPSWCAKLRPIARLLGFHA